MVATEITTNLDSAQGDGAALRLKEILRHKIGRLRMKRHTALWRDAERFGMWVEFEAGRTARQEKLDTITIDLEPGGRLGDVRIGPKRQPHALGGLERLWAFLASLGIRRVTLDERLEHNQIEDVIILLFTFRRPLARTRKTGKPPPGAASHLTQRDGLHVACTRTSLSGGVLAIHYSYCALQFSRVVRWFEQTHKTFRDHRTMFHAAPRYAVIIGLLTFLPSVVYGFKRDNWEVLSIAAFGAAGLMGIIYVFFMIVGSIEYDNEEASYRLSRAYEELKTYTDRIQKDITKARVVQQRFLPDLQNMPLPGRTAWAGSFKPTEEVGGDYFDVQSISPERIAILFADVSGHGMAAAFITAIVKTTFQSWLDQPASLADLIRRMNGALVRLTPTSSYAALFAAIYDDSARELVYANCGHHPEPWRIPAKPAEPLRALSDARTLPLGFMEDIKIKTATIALEPEDKILFVSDGIVEAVNIDGEFYGEERFVKFLEANREAAVKTLVDAAAAEADAFSGAAHQNDDRTVLAFQVCSG